MPENTEAADVLDTMANPHPRLMALARRSYVAANQRNVHGGDIAYWVGVRDAMAAATGESADEIERRVREWSP